MPRNRRKGRSRTLESRKMTTHTSPVGLLPTELLAEIFLFSVRTPTLALLDPAEPPMVLGSVCSQWRQIALSIPSLWSSLHIVIYETMDPSILDACLARSGTHLLTLEVFSSGFLDDGTRLMQSLAAHCKRWQSVHFNVRLDDFRALSDIRGSLPALHTLRITHEDNTEDDWSSSMSVPDIFEHAPHLRVFQIDASVHGNLTRLPWTQLTHFTASKCDINYIRFIVENMPSLRVCTLDNAGYEEESLGSGFEPVARHTNLRALTIVSGDKHFVWSVFEYCTLPALTELVTSGNHFGRLPASFNEFLRRSGCRIEKLAVVSCGSRWTGVRLPALIESLHEMPALGELTLTNIDTLGNTLLKDLVHRGGTATTVYPLPNLRSIEFSSDRNTPIDHVMLVRMLRSRWKPRRTKGGGADVREDSGVAMAQLEEARLYLGKCVPKATLDFLREMKGEGLHITGYYGETKTPI
ncbi:hypothetical protein PLICRDRAFT_301013 [Plicaturopsis crispa FD-325 SS-3]|nr:hypothetical protein PLICRDRAFT_301013 [Plicaturopsis crispa FD-325 SS-3]